MFAFVGVPGPRSSFTNGNMAESGSPATILLVDDDQYLRRFARRILTEHAFDIIEAGDGVDALDLASTHKGPIHLLLTDIIMPRLNGIALAERLLPQRPEMAVLFMSGYVEATLVSARHPDAILIKKPFIAAHLIDAVRAALAPVDA